MFQSIRKHWRQFRESPPGKRFQEVHKRRQQARGKQHAGRRTVFLVIGVALTLGGLALMVLPGPGTVVLAVGLMMLASESATLARFLDFCDLHLEKLLHHLRRKWGQWGTAKRVALIAFASLLTGSALAGAWYLFFGRQ